MLTGKKLDRALARFEAKIRKEEEQEEAQQLERILASLARPDKKPKGDCRR